jgi:diadenosine tetraphosphate (Ap4A) HIT family hydrolase
MPMDKDRDCLFCRWLREGSVVARFGTVAAVDDGFPVTDGHLLIVALRHTPAWFSMTDQEDTDSLTLIRTLAK